jgi:hypothetical protein
LLNGTFANSQAETLAARLEGEAASDRARQIDLAYRLVCGRPPNPKEMRLALDFLRAQSMREFALAMFNLNAFLYVN